MMNELTDFIKDNEIEIVALTIPKEAARQIAKVVADAESRLYGTLHIQILIFRMMLLLRMYICQKVL